MGIRRIVIIILGLIIIATATKNIDKCIHRVYI